MANSKANVSVGKPKIGGAVWRAPSGTTLPTDATTALGDAFVNLGYVSSDGIKNSNTKDRTEIKAWGGDTVAIPVTGHTDTFEGTFIEVLNTELIKTVHGDNNVTGTLATGISVSANGADTEEYVYVIDQELHGGVKKRIVIPCGQISKVGDVVYKDNDVIGYPQTITGLPDGNENTHYEYMQQASGT
jgi:hypothetical protein